MDEQSNVQNGEELGHKDSYPVTGCPSIGSSGPKFESASLLANCVTVAIASASTANRTLPPDEIFLIYNVVRIPLIP